MHSIVVLGDVRFHHCSRSDSEVWEEPQQPSVLNFPQYAVILPGGALMMVHAVQQMAKECRLWLRRDDDGIVRFDDAKVDQIVYSHEPYEPYNADDEQIIPWKLIRHELAGEAQKKARLRGGHEKLQINPAYRQPQAKLKEVLAQQPGNDGRYPEKGWFDQSDDNGGHLNACPDMVIFDDLDLNFQLLKFVRNLDGRNGVRIAEYRRVLEASDPEEDLKKVQEAILGTLFDRLHQARETSLAHNRAVLEPIIVGSVSRRPGRIFYERWKQDRARQEQAGEEKSVWLHLVDDPWLRRRVVILLDAQDLREDGLSISTGLSWERTAQDTISQIRHSDTYRQFLQFGHVIVRFGVTGALHIASDVEEGTRTYTLFFDPSHTDTHWDLADCDGTVLGDTAIYVAQLTRSIQQECRKFRGKPELVGLKTIVQNGIVEAIKSSERLSRTSYGDQDLMPLVRAVDSKNPRTERHYFPYGIFFTQEKIAEVCADPAGPPDPAKLWCVDFREESMRSIRVVSASIPPSLQRQWSILMQSAMVGEMEKIASQIVRDGPTQVFNYSLSNSYTRVRATLIQQLINVAYEWQWKLQEDKEYSAAKIIDKWIPLCTAAVERFNAAEEAPKNEEKARKLRPPAEDRDAWNELMPEVDVFRDHMLWHFLNSPRADRAFERILIFRAQETNGKTTFRGFYRSIRADPIIAPLVQYGEPDKPVYIVDRREVEGYRAIERLMQQHLKKVKEGSNKRPLSLALFGPPGSGKSFAVRAINQAINLNLASNLDIRVLDPYNLGQYTSVDGLERAFREIETEINDPDARKERKSVVPIAFFDEFDSSYDKQELGWLKFFLAPMEDGAFMEHNIQNAILVFAGGTRQTFDEFSMANRPSTDEQWLLFSKAKGPDFASRLSGHLDIVGINSTGAEDELFMIRRSLFIRSMLSASQKLKEGDEADIDDRMVRALLKAPDFRNGGRSIRMLLELCQGPTGSVSASSIPPIHQLNMHVDGKAFLDLLHDRSSNYQLD